MYTHVYSLKEAMPLGDDNAFLKSHGLFYKNYTIRQDKPPFKLLVGETKKILNSIGYCVFSLLAS